MNVSSGIQADLWLTPPKLVDPMTGFRRLLYLVSPVETVFDSVESVPNLTEECMPYFLLAIFLEYAILAYKGRRSSMPLNDSLSSLGIGLISQLPLLFARSVEVSVYTWIWNNWRLLDLPCDSTVVWLATLIGVDFCFYWVHRATHEVNLIWTAHQIHHSSERYNLTTALRQSALQRYLVWFVYAPLALLLPPPLFAIHLQLNLVYQFWIHTETVRKLPATLEFLFNTPSHHRVHHGRNAYCIDRNYGGLFIVFDRLFGTFRAERDDEPPVFGLVTPVTRFHPLTLQTEPLKFLASRIWLAASWSERLGLLFYGPSWRPEQPEKRLGPGVYPEIRYPVSQLNPTVPGWIKAYATAHFLAALVGYGYATTALRTASLGSQQPAALLAACLAIVWALSAIARLLEDGGQASQVSLTGCLLEPIRCAVMAAVAFGIQMRVKHGAWNWTLCAAFYLISCSGWLVKTAVHCGMHQRSCSKTD